MWRETIGINIKAGPLFEAVRKRANQLVEELTKTHRSVGCPLFPNLEGVVGIRLYTVVGKKRTQLRKDLTPLATKKGVEHLHGSNREYYVEPFDVNGQILGGRKL